MNECTDFIPIDTFMIHIDCGLYPYEHAGITDSLVMSKSKGVVGHFSLNYP